MREISRRSLIRGYAGFVLFAMLWAVLVPGCKKDHATDEPEQTQTQTEVEKQAEPKPEKTVDLQPRKEPTESVEQKTVRPEPKKTDVQDKRLRVKLQTTKGDIVIELDRDKAPVTVENFLRYAKEGYYEGTIFHRVISGFMVQGGGLTPDMEKKTTHAPIVNEAGNGLSNDRGTIAMARTSNPNSATSQFFINHRNNASLNYTGPQNLGYAVFGKVVEGMDIVDAIASVKTTRKGFYSDVPVETVVIQSAKVISGE
jgi:cyclophilin family peptidyl-prolyl cis-trans isomerase